MHNRTAGGYEDQIRGLEAKQQRMQFLVSGLACSDAIL